MKENNVEFGKIRWAYLAAGAIMLLFLGLIYAWSIFKAPFSAIYTDWTISQISFTFTISMIFFCLGGFFAGKLAARLKPRYILIIAAIMLFCGFFGVSRLNPNASEQSLKLLYFLYGVLCGGGVGMGYNSIISTVNKWFPDKTGLSSGVLMMGFGFGGIVLGSAVSAMIGIAGLFKTFTILAIAIAIVLVVGSFFIKVPAIRSVAPGSNGKEEVKSYTAGEMIKTSTFWYFIFWAILLNSGGLLVINSAASIAVAFGAPAVLGLIVSVFNGGGRVILGASFDKFGRKITMAMDLCFMLSAGICLFLGATTSAVIFILLGLLLTGIGYGGCPAITSVFTNSTFGPKNYPVNFSLANFSLIPAAIIGPMISSYLIEKSNGAYNSTFIMIVVLSIAASIMFALLNKSIKKLGKY